MKTSFLKLLVIILTINISGCKKEQTFTNFKYADKPATITCEGVDSKLYQEALYSFEDDILNYYKKAKKNTSLIQAYSQLIRNAVYGSLKYKDVVSEHTLEVFAALKNENIWDAKNPKSHLDYNSNTLKCLSNNITDKNLKTTFDALISTNSMSPKLFGAPLMNKSGAALKDKHLATYIALDFYYAKLFDVDFTKNQTNATK
ncbi:hypothetical protein [uncultured Algibacter sp.]|uniref:hypothetical protein n=1 Tax=uncultured Algibacter sp. TaxID=298659 RepID=UPI003217687D